MLQECKREFQRVGRARAAVIGFVLVTSTLVSVTPAHAIAMYDSKVEFVLNSPGAIVNTYGSRPNGCGSPGIAVSLLAATASKSAKCTELLIGPPPFGVAPGQGWPGSDPNTVSITRKFDAEVKGTAGPGLGFSIADQAIFYSVSLNNLTGRAGSFPPAQVLMAPFSGTYSYSLATSTTAPGEAAEASVKIAVRVGGAVPTGWTDVVDSCSSAPNCNHATNGQVPFAFTATLPAAKDTMMTVAISDPAGIAVAMGQPLVALGNILFVDEGQSGTSMFTVENQGGDAMISAISVTQGLTQGDPMDWANIAGVGGSCMTGNVLAAGATCSVLVDFLTDTADYGPGLDGITPFDLMFSLDDGRMAIATALVGVVDTPESASLALMVAGLAVVVLRRRKRG